MSNAKMLAIVRVEQLFPMPEKQMDDIRAKYKNAEFCWVQEEPKNMGAWTYLLRREENYTLRLVSAKPVPHQLQVLQKYMPKSSWKL